MNRYKVFLDLKCHLIVEADKLTVTENTYQFIDLKRAVCIASFGVNQVLGVIELGG